MKRFMIPRTARCKSGCWRKMVKYINKREAVVREVRNNLLFEIILLWCYAIMLAFAIDYIKFILYEYL